MKSEKESGGLDKSFKGPAGKFLNAGYCVASSWVVLFCHI